MQASLGDPGSLRPKSCDRNNKNSIGPLVCCIGKPAENAEHSGRISFLSFHLLFDFQQVIGGRIDLIRAKLDFKSAPLPIRKFNNGINLTVFIVLVMIQTGSKGFGINTQIPFTQCLKEKTECFQVPEKSGWSRFQQGTGQRRI